MRWGRPKLRWQPQNRLTIGDTDFLAMDDTGIAALVMPPSGRWMVIHKTREMVDGVAAMIEDLAPRNIVELGIAKGGSTAFLAQAARPKKLVAIEKDPTTVASLVDYIDSHGLQGTVKTYYGVDQADRSALDSIIKSEFGAEPLDCVIDDASHLLHETRVSFNILFPRLRAGGVYMIEDWGWGHYTTDMIPADVRASFWPTGIPLTVLVFELVMACAPPSKLIDEVVVDRAFVRVRRGPAELDPSTFDSHVASSKGPSNSSPQKRPARCRCAFNHTGMTRDIRYAPAQGTSPKPRVRERDLAGARTTASPRDVFRVANTLQTN